jgi:hypothetical protein
MVAVPAADSDREVNAGTRKSKSKTERQKAKTKAVNKVRSHKPARF